MNVDYILKITDQNGQPAHCRCVARTIGRTRGRTTLIVFEELNSNPGMSVTNATELFATAAVRELKLDPSRCIFIEHYPRGSVHDESFDLITYTWVASAQGLTFGYVANAPDFVPSSRETVNRWLGGAYPDRVASKLVTSAGLLGLEA